MERTALLTAGIIFLIVSIMHLLRLLLKVEVKVKNCVLPMWLSVLGVVVPLFLSLWMFKLLR
jgi:hypothetical protein